MQYFLVSFLIFSITAFGNSLEAPATDNINYDRDEDESKAQRRCLKQYKSSIIHYKKLYRYLSKRDRKSIDQDATKFIIKKSKKYCKKSVYRKAVKTVLSRHSGKLGLILPLSGKNSELGKNFSDAIHSFFKGRSNNLVELDSKGAPKHFHRKLASLVFKEKASILIGGATNYEAKLLNYWSERLRIPSLILHSPPINRGPKKSKYAFFISPSQEQMAKSLASYISNRAFAKLAIFSPENRNIEFLNGLTQSLDRNEYRSLKIVKYQPDNYDSLAQSLKDLFRMSDPEREEELELLKEEKKKTAELAGLPFDPSRVVLPPENTVDAIVVLDDFKTLRHFVNILKFLKVPPLPLLGTQGWRAPELFTPREPYFIGGVFVDYIGSYADLPYNLEVSGLEGNDLFTTPEESIGLDFWLIGKHSVDIGHRVLSYLPRDRRRIVNILRDMKTRQDSPFFKSTLVFDRKQVSNWPTFLFSITHQNLFQAFYRPAEETHLKRSPIARQKL